MTAPTTTANWPLYAISRLDDPSTDYIVVLDRYDRPLRRGVHALEITSEGESRLPFRNRVVGLFGEADSDIVLAWCEMHANRVQPGDTDAEMLYEYIGDQVLPLEFKGAWRDEEAWVTAGVRVFSYTCLTAEERGWAGRSD